MQKLTQIDSSRLDYPSPTNKTRTKDREHMMHTIHTHIHIHTYTHTHTHTRTHTHIRTYAHTHICISTDTLHTHTYTYSQTRARPPPGPISAARANEQRTADATRVLKAPGAEPRQNACGVVNEHKIFCFYQCSPECSMNKFRAYISTDTRFSLLRTHQCVSG